LRPRKQGSGAGEGPGPGDCLASLSERQVGQGGSDPIGVEEGARIADPGSRFGQPEVHLARIRCATGSGDEAEPNQRGDLKGDRGRGHPQQPGQLSREDGLRRIEVLQEAGQMGTQPDARFGVPGVPPAAGGEDGGKGGEDRPGRGGGHGPIYFG